MCSTSLNVDKSYSSPRPERNRKPSETKVFGVQFTFVVYIDTRHTSYSSRKSYCNKTEERYSSIYDYGYVDVCDTPA